MNWFWLNMPLAAVFFGAWTGIPLWLVFKRPDRHPAQRVHTSAVTGRATVAEPQLMAGSLRSGDRAAA